MVFNPDQPRNPKGSGAVSGEWMSGSAGGHEGQIATAQPTHVGAVADTYKQPSVASMAGDNDPRAATDPKIAATYKANFENDIGIFKDPSLYPNFREQDFAGKSVREQAQVIVEHLASNLQFIYEHTTDAIRERGKVWYDGAHLIAEQLAKAHGLDLASTAGVIACLSPGKDWNQNVELARRITDIYANQQDHKFDAKMAAAVHEVWDTHYINKVEVTPERLKDPAFKASYDAKQVFKAELITAITGKTLGELTDQRQKAAWIRTYDVAHNPQNYHIFQPDGSLGPIARNLPNSKNPKGAESVLVWQSNALVGNAVLAIEAKGDRTKISPLMGDAHKVRSFYNNILDPHSPNGDVTVDTHEVGAALFRSLGQMSAQVSQNFGNNKPGVQNASGSAVTGLGGTYGLYADAVRLAASREGVEPAAMQAITWDAKKATLGETSKAADAKIDQLWTDYHNGTGTLRDVQTKIWAIATKDVGAKEQGRIDKASKPPVGEPKNDSIKRTDTPDQKVAVLEKLTKVNLPIIDKAIAEIDKKYGTQSSSDIKKTEKIKSKAERPSVLADKPWFGVEYIRDSLRFKTVVDSFKDAPAIIDHLAASGFKVLKYDATKLTDPKEWGWRVLPVDFRMKNGQMVEYYMVSKEQAAVAKEGHAIFEKWRNEDPAKFSKAQRVAYDTDVAASQKLNGDAWRAFKSRTGQTDKEVLASATRRPTSA